VSTITVAHLDRRPLVEVLYDVLGQIRGVRPDPG
jgi:hypothetical protein